MNTIYTLIRIPGSGKSTFAKQNCNCVVVSTDDIRKELFGDEAIQEQGKRVFDIAYKRIQQALDNNQNVIFDATNVTKKSRKRILQFKAKHIAIVFTTPTNVCIERQQQRERKVDKEIINKMQNKFVFPTKEEGFNEIKKIKKLLKKY